MPMMIKNEEDLFNCIKSIHNDRVVPIFLLSSVTGKNLDLIRKFLNVIPPRIQWDVLVKGPPEVLIDQTYFVTGVGTVVGGTVMSGIVSANENMLLGPDGNGIFIPIQIKSVHSKRLLVKSAYAGQSAGFAIKKIKRSMIRKGMVLVDMKANPKSTWNFEADVIILYHSTTIHTNYQPVIQCMTMRQSAKITHIFEREILRTGDRARVRFKFLYRPEYLKEGMRIIFREGRCKGIGIITKVHCDDNDLPPVKPKTTENNNNNNIKQENIVIDSNEKINHSSDDNIEEESKEKKVENKTLPNKEDHVNGNNNNTLVIPKITENTNENEIKIDEEPSVLESKVKRKEEKFKRKRRSKK